MIEIKKVFTKENMNIRSVNCCSNCVHYSMNLNYDYICNCTDDLIYIPAFICDEYKNRWENND